MTKKEFLVTVQKLYRAMNLADSDHPDRPDWMFPGMAANYGCGHLDSMMHDLVSQRVITSEEFQEFHDTM